MTGPLGGEGEGGPFTGADAADVPSSGGDQKSTPTVPSHASGGWPDVPQVCGL